MTTLNLSSLLVIVTRDHKCPRLTTNKISVAELPTEGTKQKLPLAGEFFLKPELAHHAVRKWLYLVLFVNHVGENVPDFIMRRIFAQGDNDMWHERFS